MKTWQALVVGGVCGAVVAGVVVRWTNHSLVGVAVEQKRDAGSFSARDRFAAGSGLTAGNIARGYEEMVGEKLEAEILRLRAWLDGAGPRLHELEVRRILAAWSKQDARAVLDVVSGGKRFPDRIHALSVPLAELAKRDPGEVADWIRVHVREDERRALFGALAGSMVRGSPQQLVQILASYPEAEKSHTLRFALGVLLHGAPAMAGDFLDLIEEKKVVVAPEEIAGVITAWAWEDPMAAWNWAQKRKKVGALAEIPTMLIARVATVDPRLARRTVEEEVLAGRIFSGNHGVRVVQALLTKSPADAEAVLPLLDQKIVEQALEEVAGSELEDRPDATVELFKRWLAPEKRQGILADGYERWLRSDARAAEAWAANESDPETRDALNAGAFKLSAERDAETAMISLQGLTEIPKAIRKSAKAAFENWSVSKPSAAAEWALTNPELVSPGEIAQLGYFFARTDEAAAVTWVAKLPGGQMRESAVEGVAALWVGAGEFQLANQMIASVTDVERREAIMFRLYSGKRARSDPKRLEKWLDALPLDAETKERWRQKGGPK